MELKPEGGGHWPLSPLTAWRKLDRSEALARLLAETGFYWRNAHASGGGRLHLPLRAPATRRDRRKAMLMDRPLRREQIPARGDAGERRTDKVWNATARFGGLSVEAFVTIKAILKAWSCAEDLWLIARPDTPSSKTWVTISR